MKINFVTNDHLSLLKINFVNIEQVTSENSKYENTCRKYLQKLKKKKFFVRILSKNKFFCFQIATL